jgi:hypothetical protein
MAVLICTFLGEGGRLPIIPEGGHNIERIRRAAGFNAGESPIQALTSNLGAARMEKHPSFSLISKRFLECNRLYRGRKKENNIINRFISIYRLV